MNAQMLLRDLSTQGIIVTADDGRLSVDGPDDLVTDDLLIILLERKADLLAALLLKLGICLDCDGAMDRQGGDCWFCATCRMFAHGNGRLMARPVIPKPLTFEKQEAQRLLADLQAAGCGVHWSGQELRITNLTKISTVLWMQIENAGP